MKYNTCKRRDSPCCTLIIWWRAGLFCGDAGSRAIRKTPMTSQGVGWPKHTKLRSATEKEDSKSCIFYHRRTKYFNILTQNEWQQTNITTDVIGHVPLNDPCGSICKVKCDNRKFQSLFSLNNKQSVKQITEQELASREKHNPKDQREEMHFVTAGRNWIFLWPFAAIRSSPEGELSSSPDHSSTPSLKVSKICVNSDISGSQMLSQTSYQSIAAYYHFWSIFNLLIKWLHGGGYWLCLPLIGLTTSMSGENDKPSVQNK